MRASVFLIATLSGLWLVWSGHYTYDGKHPQILLFGLLSVSGVTLLCRRLGIVDDDTAPLQYGFRAARYWLWLGVQSIRSSLKVLRIILRPWDTNRPATVRVAPLQTSDLFRVTYANSITLTPGTVTVEANDEEFVVHALAQENVEGLNEGEMNRRVYRLETGRYPETGRHPEEERG